MGGGRIFSRNRCLKCGVGAFSVLVSPPVLHLPSTVIIYFTTDAADYILGKEL